MFFLDVITNFKLSFLFLGVKSITFCRLTSLSPPTNRSKSLLGVRSIFSLSVCFLGLLEIFFPLSCLGCHHYLHDLYLSTNVYSIFTNEIIDQSYRLLYLQRYHSMYIRKNGKTSMSSVKMLNKNIHQNKFYLLLLQL